MRDGDILPPIVSEHDATWQAVEEAQFRAELKNAAKRQAERTLAYQEWSKPENVKERLERLMAEAEEAEKRGKEMAKSARRELGLPEEEPALPPLEELPKHMRNQSPSTIRAMLRHDRGWEIAQGRWQKSGAPTWRIK